MRMVYVSILRYTCQLSTG